MKITVGRIDARAILALITSSVSIGGVNKHVETLSHYRTIKWEYRVHAEEGGGGGSVVGTWDLAETRPSDGPEGGPMVDEDACRELLGGCSRGGKS